MVSRPASLYRPISGGGIGFPRTVSNADTFGISLAIYFPAPGKLARVTGSKGRDKLARERDSSDSLLLEILDIRCTDNRMVFLLLPFFLGPR